MASDLSSGCTETIDILDEKEEGEISLEDVSSSEEGGIGHLTCGYVIRQRQSCPGCKSTWGECASWCTANSKAYCSKNQSRRDPVKGKENRHHINEAGCATTRHMTVSTLQEKNDDLVPISSDSDMEIVGLTDASKQLVNQLKVRVKKKKKRKKDYDYLTVDDLISPASVDISVTECFNDSKETSNVKGTSLSRAHYRETSPLRRSGRSRVISRSPLRRYKSPVRTRSPFRPSRSPLSHSRSPSSLRRSPPLLRRSPRRIRSPKLSRSSYESPVRTTSRKLSRLNSSPPTRLCVDRYRDVTRLLLKKVKSVGAQASESSTDRNKEHQPASLRQKLSNMMKRPSEERRDGSGNSTHRKEKSSIPIVIVDDADDEEDLALLRQKALETKQKNRSNRTEHSTETESERKSVVATAIRTDDDQDEEDLQLRMIALRSAVMKKHQNRVQLGVPRAKSKKATAIAVTSVRSESPFSQSFIDNIPIPGDELLKFASPPCTPLPQFDSNHIEDMELDTDVEREKEKLPYSPTDKITDVTVDTELLGIEPSDVSFINLNDANSSPIYNMMNEQKSVPINLASIMLHNSYLPRYDPSPKRFTERSSPRDDGSFHANSSDRELPSYLGDSQDSVECDLIDGICCREGTYSSSNVPMYEKADLPVTKEPLPASSASSNHVFIPMQMQNSTEQSSSDLPSHADLTSNSQSNKLQDNEHACDTASRDPIADSPTPSALGSTSPNGSLVTIDDLPETDGDAGSPVVSGHKKPATNYIPNEELSCRGCKTVQESVCTQDLPDVTKDVNRIPTLIGRKLVPAPILRSNKRLQQRLLKKHDTHPEPIFKSAEMQPVIVTAEETANISTNFKPIKLVSFPKKSPTVLTTLTEFKDSVNENVENTSKSDSNHEVTELKDPATDTQTMSNDSNSAYKKQKRVKKKSKNKNPNAEKSAFAIKESNLCTNVDKNINMIETVSIPQQQIVEYDREKSNGDEKSQYSPVENKESSNLENTTVIQKSPLSNLQSSDMKLHDTNHAEKNEQCISSSGKEEPKHTILLSEHSQEKKIESNNCLLTKSTDADAHSRDTDVTKESDNRRQSIDENEDELRAILLASLAKRTTKPSDVSGISTVLVTTMNSQVSVQNTSMNTIASTAVNTTTSNTNAPLSSTLNLQQEPPEMTKDNATINTNDKSVLSLNNNRKRLNTMVTKGSSKKIMKKTPASTKVVNNAKKYQNTVQRKSNNLQKHDINACNDKPKQDDAKSVNMPLKTSIKIHAPETRLVIHLSSDSDSESETEKHKSDPVSSTVNINAQDVKSDFEKSLHKFLRDVRKEHESAAACKPASSPQATKRDTPPLHTEPKESSNMQTPSAVRHLPASQQEEYRRLKQQILEREKLKLQRKTANRNSNSSNSNSSNKSVNNMSSLMKSLLPYDKESTAVKQTQVKLKELERNSQQSPTEVKTRSADAGKSTSIFCCTTTNKNISANIAKQTNSVQMQAKNIKKTIPNLSISITNEITSAHAATESRTIESPIDSVSKHQLMSNKQQFRAALRTLSKDEINRKYVQIQLKQDVAERVVTINDKSVQQHDTVNDDQSKKFIENDNVTAGSSDERMVDRRSIFNDNISHDSEFSNASTMILSNLSTNLNAEKQEVDTTLEITMSRSRYEQEREINRIISAFLPLESNDDSKDASQCSNINANDKSNTDNILNALRKDTKTELDFLKCLSEVEQQRYLNDTEHKLVARRYNVLDHLAEMSGDLRQWDMEMDLQSSLIIEVKKLKEQLRIAEQRLQAQSNRFSTMGPKISTARQKMNVERHECFKLSNICSFLGNQLVGKDYKLPEAGNQLLSDRLKEVISHIRQLTKKKLLSNNFSGNSILSTSSLPELSKILEKNLLLQEQLTNDTKIANNVAESKDDISNSERSNDVENSLTSNISQTVPNQETPMRTSQTSATVSESCSNEQNTPNQDNISPSDPKLSSTPILIKQDNKCTQRIRRMDIEPAIPTESRLSATDTPLQDDHQQNKEKILLPPPMSRTTTSTTTVIEPYVSILTLLKTPRNTNPNGVLCPYDLMGTCNDKDCRFVHQSTSHL